MAGLHFDITGDNKNLLRNIEGSKQGIRSLTREAEKESLNLDDIMKRIGQSAAAIGAGFSATQLIRDVARVRGEFQQLEVALNTMLGSEEKANALFQQLVNTAAKTPFDLKGVAGGAKQLLAYGVAAEEVNDTIIRLGDIAAGLSIPLGDLVYLYGTTMTQGRLFTQDLRQFMGRGIPLADELAKQFGVAKDEVGGLVTAGKVGFSEVEKAIRAMTSEGGKFAGLMENQSKTITGQISNLEDAVDSMFNEIGKSTQGAISGVLSTTTQMVENYEKVGEAIGAISLAYGTYKAAVAIGIAIKKIENKILLESIAILHANAKAKIDMSKAEVVAAAKANVFAAAQKSVAASLKSVWKATLANPYAWIAAAVTGAAIGLYKVATASTEAEEAQKRMTQTTDKVEKSVTSEISKLSDLQRRLKEVKKDSEEYEIIKSKIVKDYGKYYEGLDKEIDRVGDLSEAYSILIANMRKTMGERQFQSFFNAEQEHVDKVIGQKIDQAYDALVKKYGEAEGLVLYQQFYDSIMNGATLSVEAINKLKEATFFEMKWGENAQDGVVDFTNSVFNLRTEINRTKSASDAAIKAFQKKYSISDNTAASLLSGKEGSTSTEGGNEESYDEAYNEAEAAWIKAKKALDDAIRNRKSVSRERYKELVEDEKAKADAFKALGGVTSAKAKKEEKDYSKEIDERIKGYIREKEEQRKQYEELLEEFETYEQARERIAKEYAEKRKQMVNEDGSLKAGFTQGNIDNLEAQQRADEEEIDQMFVEKNEVYKGWLEEIEKMTLDNLREALVNAQFALELAKARGNGEGVALAEAQVEKLQEKIKDVSSETDPKKRSVEEWKALSEVISEASGVFEELGDSIGDTAGEILKSVGSIGSSTVGLINNITQLTQMSIEGTKETAETSSKAVQAVEKASVILAIISAAIQIITKIINLGKQLHNAKYEKAIEASQDKIDDLSKSYENLAEKVDEAFGNTRVQGLKELNANLERQNALIRQQMEDEKQVKQKDSEYEAAMDEYNAQLEENKKKQEENKKAMEEAIFGEDIQSAIENFADAYAEALEGNMDMNATAKEQAVRMMKNMVMESIKEYVAGSKKMEQIRAKMDALYADGVFSAADQKLIINELEQFNKELDDRFGWAEDLFNEEEASSSSSKRGIATASQESVDENNGRLMSIQLSMGEIKEQMIYTVTYLASMSSGVAAGNNILSDIREQAVRTNGHLEDIVKYTKPLNDKISEVVSAVNKINSK